MNRLTAKEYLSRYRTLNDSINAKLAQVEELRRKAQTVGGGNGTGAHSTQPHSRVADITDRLVDLEREINEEIDRSVDLQREIRAAIAAVPEERLRTLLELRYINCMTFEQIAVSMHYSYKQVCRLHGKALLEIRCP